MATNTLVMPFLNPDPVYAFGVEFGMLYPQLRDDSEPISEYFTIQNQDQILLAASRLGWVVAEMKPWKADWFFVRLEKGATT